MGLFKKKQEKAEAKKQEGGLTVSNRVLKDQHLSSDFILGAIEDSVVMVGRDNVIHLFNPSASKVTGWPAAEAVGLDYHNVLALANEKGEPCPPDTHPFAKALSSNKTQKDNDSLLITRSGKRVAVSLIVSPVIEAGNTQASSVVGVFRDITQEKAQEAQRSDFISTASHEMRTPVAAIEGYLALSLNPKITTIDDNARKLLEKASTATKQLGVLFQDLLTSSRAEDGRLTSYPIVVEIGELTQQVAEAERFHAKEKNLGLRYVINTDGQATAGKILRPLYYVYADPHRLREVLQNIIDNAIKYTAEGEVVVRLTGDAATVQIQVQDTGSGIPPEDIPHLFQKFYRVDSSMTRTVGGSGLGLFISRKVIELYNGRLWVESKMGNGSTFFINLPRLTTASALEMQQRQASTVSPLDNR